MRAPHLALLLLALTGPALARYARVETEEVPIERLIANLERQLQSGAADPETPQPKGQSAAAAIKLNLARLHAMAWALKTEVATVRSGSTSVWNGYEADRIPWSVQPTDDPARAEKARKHLEEALRLHREAFQAAPQDPIARLGLGWCLLQSGDKPGAAGVLRPIVEEAWKEDQARRSLGLGTLPLTQEAGGYLIQALDPARDAAEIGELQARIARLAELPRAVTPLVIPLAPDLAPDALLAPRARVRFDLDGVSPQATWSWITPHAGWLVLLPRDGARHVDSGLQLLGSVSWWLFWEHGYQALAALDDDGDGALRGTELAGLGVWQDLDQDGACDPGEVRTVAEAGIEALACGSAPHAHPDVLRWSPAGVTFRGGEVRPTWDVLLRRAPGD